MFHVQDYLPTETESVPKRCKLGKLAAISIKQEEGVAKEFAQETYLGRTRQGFRVSKVGKTIPQHIVNCLRANNS